MKTYLLILLIRNIVSDQYEKDYEIIEFSNIFMHHKLGRITEQRSLKNLKKSNTFFSLSMRLYYMTRNFLYMKNRYKKEFQVKNYHAIKKIYYTELKTIYCIKLTDMKTIRYFYKAYSDFKHNKMGKLLLII